MVVLDCEIPLVSVNEKYIVARGRMIQSCATTRRIDEV